MTLVLLSAALWLGLLLYPLHRAVLLSPEFRRFKRAQVFKMKREMVVARRQMRARIAEQVAP